MGFQGVPSIWRRYCQEVTLLSCGQKLHFCFPSFLLGFFVGLCQMSWKWQTFSGGRVESVGRRGIDGSNRRLFCESCKGQWIRLGDCRVGELILLRALQGRVDSSDSRARENRFF